MPVQAEVPLREIITGLTGVVTGFALAFFTRGIRNRGIDDESEYDSDEEEEDTPSSLGGEHEDQKLVLCVRTDLKMQKGKIAAQVGHATLAAYKEARKKTPQWVRAWEGRAQPKIAVQIRSEQEAKRLYNAAKSKGLASCYIRDAGRTQIAAVSVF